MAERPREVRGEAPAQQPLREVSTENFTPVLRVTKKETTLIKGDGKLQRVTVTEDVSHPVSVEVPAACQVNPAFSWVQDSAPPPPHTVRVPRARKDEEDKVSLKDKKSKISSMKTVNKENVPNEDDTVRDNLKQGPPIKPPRKSREEKRDHIKTNVKLPNNEPVTPPPEVEFEKIYKEVSHDKTPTVIDESILEAAALDGEELQASFDEIVHAYQESKQAPTSLENTDATMTPRKIPRRRRTEEIKPQVNNHVLNASISMDENNKNNKDSDSKVHLDDASKSKDPSRPQIASNSRSEKEKVDDKKHGKKVADTNKIHGKKDVTTVSQFTKQKPTLEEERTCTPTPKPRQNNNQIPKKDGKDDQSNGQQHPITAINAKNKPPVESSSKIIIQDPMKPLRSKDHQKPIPTINKKPDGIPVPDSDSCETPREIIKDVSSNEKRTPIKAVKNAIKSLLPKSAPANKPSISDFKPSTDQPEQSPKNKKGSTDENHMKDYSSNEMAQASATKHYTNKKSEIDKHEVSGNIVKSSDKINPAVIKSNQFNDIVEPHKNKSETHMAPHNSNYSDKNNKLETQKKLPQILVDFEPRDITQEKTIDANSCSIENKKVIPENNEKGQNLINNQVIDKETETLCPMQKEQIISETSKQPPGFKIEPKDPKTKLENKIGIVAEPNEVNVNQNNEKNKTNDIAKSSYSNLKVPALKPSPEILTYAEKAKDDSQTLKPQFQDKNVANVTQDYFVETPVTIPEKSINNQKADIYKRQHIVIERPPLPDFRKELQVETTLENKNNIVSKTDISVLKKEKIKVTEDISEKQIDPQNGKQINAQVEIKHPYNRTDSKSRDTHEKSAKHDIENPIKETVKKIYVHENSNLIKDGNQIAVETQSSNMQNDMENNGCDNRISQPKLNDHIVIKETQELAVESSVHITEKGIDFQNSENVHRSKVIIVDKPQEITETEMKNDSDPDTHFEKLNQTKTLLKIDENGIKLSPVDEKVPCSEEPKKTIQIKIYDSTPKPKDQCDSTPIPCGNSGKVEIANITIEDEKDLQPVEHKITKDLNTTQDNKIMNQDKQNYPPLIIAEIHKTIVKPLENREKQKTPIAENNLLKLAKGVMKSALPRPVDKSKHVDTKDTFREEALKDPVKNQISIPNATTLKYIEPDDKKLADFAKDNMNNIFLNSGPVERDTDNVPIPNVVAKVVEIQDETITLNNTEPRKHNSIKPNHQKKEKLTGSQIPKIKINPINVMDTEPKLKKYLCDENIISIPSQETLSESSGRKEIAIKLDTDSKNQIDLSLISHRAKQIPVNIIKDNTTYKKIIQSEQKEPHNHSNRHESKSYPTQTRGEIEKVHETVSPEVVSPEMTLSLDGTLIPILKKRDTGVNSNEKEIYKEISLPTPKKHEFNQHKINRVNEQLSLLANREILQQSVSFNESIEQIERDAVSLIPARQPQTEFRETLAKPKDRMTAADKTESVFCINNELPKKQSVQSKIADFEKKATPSTLHRNPPQSSPNVIINNVVKQPDQVHRRPTIDKKEDTTLKPQVTKPLPRKANDSSRDRVVDTVNRKQIDPSDKTKVSIGGKIKKNIFKLMDDIKRQKPKDDVPVKNPEVWIVNEQRKAQKIEMPAVVIKRRLPQEILRQESVLSRIALFEQRSFSSPESNNALRPSPEKSNHTLRKHHSVIHENVPTTSFIRIKSNGGDDQLLVNNQDVVAKGESIAKAPNRDNFKADVSQRPKADGDRVAAAEYDKYNKYDRAKLVVSSEKDLELRVSTEKDKDSAVHTPKRHRSVMEKIAIFEQKNEQPPQEPKTKRAANRAPVETGFSHSPLDGAISDVELTTNVSKLEPLNDGSTMSGCTLGTTTQHPRFTKSVEPAAINMSNRAVDNE